MIIKIIIAHKSRNKKRRFNWENYSFINSVDLTVNKRIISHVIIIYDNRHIVSHFTINKIVGELL